MQIDRSPLGGPWQPFPHSGRIGSSPVTALDDLLAAHGAGVRPLYEVIDLLRTGPRELADLVRLAAAPRRSVEDVLAALERDLERSAAGVRIAPDALPRYEAYRLPR